MTAVACCIDSCQYRCVSKSAPGLAPLTLLSGVACCSPLARAPLSAEAAETLAGVLKALADPARPRLLSLVMAHAGGEACVCELTGPLGLTQPTVSHHLKVLTEAGLLTRDKRGVWAYYRIVPETLAAVREILAAPSASGAPS